MAWHLLIAALAIAAFGGSLAFIAAREDGQSVPSAFRAGGSAAIASVAALAAVGALVRS